MPKVSLVMAVWNTSHLLGRTLHSLTQQTFDDFEVIVIDDNSEDDVAGAIEPYQDKLDIKLHSLHHDLGMRGNTVSFNVGFSLAQGEMILENTPEIMFYPDCVNDMVSVLEGRGPASWISIRTYNITPEDQMQIETVDWKKDVRNLENLPNFHSDWTQNNTKQPFFGTHQTCIFYREDWFKYWVRYPFFLDYGTDDPWNAGVRNREGIDSYTIEPFVYHQWHAPIGFWMALDKAPNWNIWGHTMRNHYNDPLVPEGGTALLWDRDNEGGPYRMMTEQEAEGWRHLKQEVIGTGFKLRYGGEW